MSATSSRSTPARPAQVLRCGPCNREFQTQRGLSSHSSSKTHLSVISTASVLGCNVCVRIFKTKEALDDHLRQPPAGHAPPEPVPQAQKQPDRVSIPSVRVQALGSPNGKALTTSQPSTVSVPSLHVQALGGPDGKVMVTSQPGIVTAPLIRVQGLGNPDGKASTMEKCPYCVTGISVYPTKAALAQHTQTEHCFICEACLEGFPDGPSLDRHIRTSVRHRQYVDKERFRRLQNKRISPIRLAPRQPISNGMQQTSGPQTQLAISSSRGMDEIAEVSYETQAQDIEGRWTVLPATQHPECIKALTMGCHSMEELGKNRYQLAPFTVEDIAGLRKCKYCACKSCFFER